MNAIQLQFDSFIENKRPILPPKTHPVETGRYLIATKAIDQLCDTVTTWVDTRCPGGIIHGRPRLGKTRAIQYLINELSNENGLLLPVCSATCRQYRAPSEVNFFEDMLKDVGHAIVGGLASSKRDRLSKFFIEKAEWSRTNRIVLIIDEAQRLQQIQYDWLMDIYNELDNNGISMTVVLVGQDELLHQRSVFMTLKKVQIVGRFMVHTFKFEGVKKVSDLMTCMAGYDEYSEYPETSNCSFTRYFFPDLFENGFRLQLYAHELFEVFKELRQENGIKKALEIPMQYVTLTIEYCLKRYGINGKNIDKLGKIHWREAVEHSGYIHAEMYQDIV
ncbi:ATP-binding protein [Desulfotomaculum sp. 1211_IL3151]|uniref:ATP-binding protein n=1 Tax=Desulfotomaculum sp. 1211_IL3151 TaxID=3084055 RepID=UPI002FD99199